MIKKPNFFCIGAQKAGTTTLYNLLIQHPEIYLPIKKKETHFFDRDENYAKGVDWYLKKYFCDVIEEKVIGEITPAYSYYSKVPDRIFKTFGSDIKFIFILRNPVDRALSLYNMMLSREMEDLSFIEAIKSEEERISPSHSRFKKNFSYIDRGFYSKQLMNYLIFFKKKNILILSFEKEIINDLENTLIKIESFLQIDHYPSINLNIHSNPSNVKERFKNIYKIKKQLKRILPFIPKPLKIKLNSFFFTKVPFEKISLNENEKQSILKKYYFKEIEKINELTDNKFAYWMD